MKAKNTTTISAAEYTMTVRFILNDEIVTKTYVHSGKRDQRGSLAAISELYGVTVNPSDVRSYERKMVAYEFDATTADILDALAKAGIYPTE